MAKRQPKSKQSKQRESEGEDEVKQAKHAKHSKQAKHSEDESETESEDEGEAAAVKIQNKQSKHSEAEDEGDDGDDGDDTDGDGSDGDHDDKDQDVALIKKMIAQYLGDGAKDLDAEETEALHAFGKEAYQAHKEMGKKEDEAFKHAGEAMKLAHHIACKKKEDESETESEDEDAPPPPPKKGKKPAPKAPPAKGDDDGDSSDDGDDDGDDDAEAEDEAESEDEHESEKKESSVKKLKQRLLEAEGRIAALAAKSKKVEVDGYVDRKLKEAKQPNSITKRFREAAGPFKSKADFDSKWKIFREGINNAHDDVDWGTMMEKSTVGEDGSKVEGGRNLDFSDCAE